jgi:FtsP/CotA-like multicopper oxidase with cupredoxin domain
VPKLAARAASRWATHRECVEQGLSCAKSWRPDGRSAAPSVVNGVLPGPVLRFREGEPAIIRMTNRLGEPTSIHWGGLLIPPDIDGVPGRRLGTSHRAAMVS